MILSLLSIGSYFAAIKLKNDHSEEMARIEAIKDKNEQLIAIKRFAEENNLKLNYKKLELEFQKNNLEYNIKNKQAENEKEYKKDLTDNARKQIEAFDYREREKIHNEYELKSKEHSITLSRYQMENDRLTEDMRDKNKIESKKVDNNYLKEIRELEDKRELNKLYENNRHDEKIREIEAQKQVDSKKCDIERLSAEERIKKADMAHEKEMKLLQNNHEEKTKLMERDSKKVEQEYELKKEKMKGEHTEKTKQMEIDFNLTIETLKGNNQKELEVIQGKKEEMKGDQEYRMKKLELQFQFKFKQMDQQNNLINNQINFTKPGHNPYEYSYPQPPQPLNYYNIHMYRNPPNEQFQTPANNFNYQYQSPYGNTNQFNFLSRQYNYPPPQMNQNQYPQFQPQYNNNYISTKPMELLEENNEEI